MTKTLFNLHRRQNTEYKTIDTDRYLLPSSVKVKSNFEVTNRGQFHESKVKCKIPPCGIPLNFYRLFSTFFWLNVCLISSFEVTITLKLDRIYSQGEKSGEVSIKVLKNSTWRNFILNF